MPGDILTAVLIPFRDRGTDPLRARNLERVLAYWHAFEEPLVVCDGRLGSQQFNRSAAYNRGMAVAREQLGRNPDVWVFAESDITLPSLHLMEAYRLALEKPGLVVPFTDYHYLRPEDSERIRRGQLEWYRAKPQWKMSNGRSIGAVNVVSHTTMEMVGCWDESFEGSWYDDKAMQIAFDLCSGNDTRYVEGPAYHLYHLPGWSGQHLSTDDKAATARNKERLESYVTARDTRNVALCRKLLHEGTARD